MMTANSYYFLECTLVQLAKNFKCNLGQKIPVFWDQQIIGLERCFL